MKVNGWHLVRLVAEAQRDLVGGSVEHIRRSPDRARLAFAIGSRQRRSFLILGVRGEPATLYWTRHRDSIPGWEAYERTETFNRLRLARLIGVGMAPLDRVVRFEFEKVLEENESIRRFSLVAGWVGSTSNLWLVDSADDTILETFHIEADSDRTRPASKKRSLKLPNAPDLADWRTMTLPEYRKLRQAEPELALSDFLRKRFWGIDSGLARQAAEKLRETCPDNTAADAESSLEHWEEFQALVRVGGAAIDPDVSLTIADEGSDPGDIRLASELSEKSSSLAPLLALCDARQPKTRVEDDKRGRVFAAIETAIKKNDRRLASLARTLAEEGRAEEYKKQGDLLSANRHLLSKGQAEARVEDWQSDQTVVITLNPARSPQQNIDDCYRKSRKASDALKAAHSERPHLIREQERLRAALAHLESSVDSPDALQEIASSLGLDTESNAPGSGRTGPRLPYREFVLGKERLWVGRSSRDNDELTLRFARPQDIFFHVHDSPGSHVILKRDAKNAALDKNIIVQAAQVAAFFSKAKHTGLVPVAYTEARFVRKPRKAPAGTVSVEREKTVMVRPLPPPGYHEKNPPN